MKSEVAIVMCNSYDTRLVLEAVRRSIDLMGGITQFVKPQSKVLVKPNLLMATEPEAGVTTHPEVVRAAIKILKEINCKIFLGDGPSVWGNQIEDVERVYERTGIKKICHEEAVDLVKFDQRRWRGKFPLTTWLDECDCVFNIPKFKTHELTVLTGAIKNLFGLVSGTYKTELHKNYFEIKSFSEIIVDVYEAVKPAITVVDGIVAMEGDGPATSGKLRRVNALLASSDGVALDSVMALIMGLKPSDVLTTMEAARRGLGVSDVNSIAILGQSLSGLLGKPFLLPTSSPHSRIPRPIINIAKRLIKYYPCVERDNCIKCAACVQACPHQAIQMKNNRIVFDYAKCLACFCCQEACAYSAIKVKKSLAARIMGL